MLPVLLARLAESRATFDAFSAAVDRDPERAFADEEALERIEELQQRCRRLGWCLGIVAAARGSNLLRARRERRGLPDLLELVEAALDRRFAPPASELPTLDPAAGDGWQAPFVLAYLFLCAGRGRRPGPCTWTLTRDASGWELVFDGPGPPGEELAHELTALAPGLALDVTSAGHTRARFPLGWLEPGP